MPNYIPLVTSSGVQKPNNKAGGAAAGFAEIGSAVLVAGTVTVANTTVGANSLILITNSKLGTVTAPKFMTITRSNGVSFTITSTDVTDTSTISYILIP